MDVYRAVTWGVKNGPKIWYSGLKTLKFKTRPSRVISPRSRHKGKEGREVVKGQFQPHAVVTDRPLDEDIIFKPPRNSSGRTAIWHRRAVWIPNSIGRGRLDSAKLRVVRKLIAGPEGGGVRAHMLHVCCVRVRVFYELPSHAREITVSCLESSVVRLLRYIQGLISSSYSWF